jgi:membrane protein
MTSDVAQARRPKPLGVRGLIGRAHEFFDARIWAPRPGELGRRRAFFYRAARIGYATFQGVFEKRLTFRAAALTYYSALSVVPFLAFLFSIVKGFGGYQKLMEGTLRPYLRVTFGSSPSLLEGMEKVLGFVERTDVASLGTFGGIVLAYSALSLMSTIETALNEIWGAKSARPLLRRVTDYTTLLVVTPLLALAAVTVATAAQSSSLVTFLRQSLDLGGVIDFLLGLTSLVLVSAAIFAVFVIMPNAHVRLGSALLGGVVGGLLWQGALVLHVKFQVGVAGYNALYSGFAAIPIFLFWMYLSWMLVLLAAELAANHQQEPSLRQAVRARHVDQEVRETLALAIAVDLARRHIAGDPPRSQVALAEAFAAPQPTVEQVLDALVGGGVLVRAVSGKELGYVPARDIDGLHTSDVLKAVRSDPDARELKAALDASLGAGMRDVLRAADKASCQPDLSLRALALRAGDVTVTPAQERRDDPAGFDPKQPEVAT